MNTIKTVLRRTRTYLGLDPSHPISRRGWIGLLLIAPLLILVARVVNLL